MENTETSPAHDRLRNFLRLAYEECEKLPDDAKADCMVQAIEDAITQFQSIHPPPARIQAQPHTSGPWIIDRQSPHSPICIKPIPGRIVCDIDGADEESEANARLIAAAPELLHACKELLKAYEDERRKIPAGEITKEDALDAVIVKRLARTVIAKASHHHSVAGTFSVDLSTSQRL